VCLASISGFLVSSIALNPAASLRKPRYQRAREPHIFLPAEVEEIGDTAHDPHNRTLVSLLAYFGPTARDRLPASPGRASASAQSATGTPSVTASASRRCSPRSPSFCANGSSLGQPEGKQPVIPPTTARLRRDARMPSRCRTRHVRPALTRTDPRRPVGLATSTQSWVRTGRAATSSALPDRTRTWRAGSSKQRRTCRR
jgi:hypothetical protein